jgi:hypothetical protein
MPQATADAIRGFMSQRPSNVVIATLVADCIQIENAVARKVYRRKDRGHDRASW